MQRRFSFSSQSSVYVTVAQTIADVIVFSCSSLGMAPPWFLGTKMPRHARSTGIDLARNESDIVHWDRKRESTDFGYFLGTSSRRSIDLQPRPSATSPGILPASLLRYSRPPRSSYLAEHLGCRASSVHRLTSTIRRVDHLRRSDVYALTMTASGCGRTSPRLSRSKTLSSAKEYFLSRRYRSFERP